MKIGDRVEATDGWCKGESGVIIGESIVTIKPIFLVEFDNWSGGHDGRKYTLLKGNYGKPNRCWCVHAKYLKLISTPQHWKLVIHPDKSNPDITIATLYDGYTKRTESVKRYYKDDYSADTAIKAVVGKMYKAEPLTVKATIGLRHKDSVVAFAGAIKAMSDMAKSIKSASPVKEVERYAKPGEYIKIVDAKDSKNCYKNGEIYPVKDCTGVGGDVHVETGKSMFPGKTHAYVDADEYVVLENYIPPVAEPVKVEPPKPVMIGDKELRVGSKFILKPYKDITYVTAIGESTWNTEFTKIHKLEKFSGRDYIFDGLFNYQISAIDRIIED